MPVSMTDVPGASRPPFRSIRWVADLPRPLLAALAVAMVGGLGYLDIAAGPVITLSVFYLVPITLATWCLGRNWGFAAAVACGALAFYDTIDMVPPGMPLVVPLWSAAAHVTFFAMMMWLVGALRESVEHHKALASTDEMTGVGNRRAFLDAAARELSRSRRTGQPLTVIFTDLDNLKPVNDKFGHAAGDKVLRATARTVREHVRTCDAVARIGGDEFVVLLPGTDGAQAKAVVRKLRLLLADVMDFHGWPVTFSMGVLTIHEPPADADEIVRRADALQYAAKHGGKDMAVFEVLGAPAAPRRAA